MRPIPQLTLVAVAALTVVVGGCKKDEDKVGVDLHIAESTVSPAAPTTDSTIEVGFKLANAGEAAVDGARWEVRIDDQVLAGGVAPRLAGRDGSSSTVSFPALEPGTHTLRVVADPANQVREDNEGNNVATLPVTIAAAPAPFDLRIDGTPGTMPAMATASDATLRFSVRNVSAGAGRTMNHAHWHLSVDGVYFGSGSFPAIAPGATSQQTYRLDGTRAGTAGTHRMRLELDPHHVLHETDEGNNVIEFDVVIAPSASG